MNGDIICNGLELLELQMCLDCRCMFNWIACSSTLPNKWLSLTEKFIKVNQSKKLLMDILLVITLLESWRVSFSWNSLQDALIVQIAEVMAVTDLK